MRGAVKSFIVTAAAAAALEAVADIAAGEGVGMLQGLEAADRLDRIGAVAAGEVEDADGIAALLAEQAGIECIHAA